MAKATPISSTPMSRRRALATSFAGAGAAVAIGSAAAVAGLPQPVDPHAGLWREWQTLSAWGRAHPHWSEDEVEDFANQEDALFNRLASTEPQTLAGLAVLLRFVHECSDRARDVEVDLAIATARQAVESMARRAA